MHTIFHTTGLPLVVLLGGFLLLHCSSSPTRWEIRRALHLVVLTLPLAITLLLIGGWVHVHMYRNGQSPFFSSWNHWVEMILVALLSLLILGAAGYGGIRLLL